jgi:hypothetical protein
VVPCASLGRCSGAMHRRSTSLSASEAIRALYIDFEGRKDRPPVLLGCTRRSRLREAQHVWQAVTDLRFAEVARRSGIECMTLSDAVERILQRAERADRMIVAWSEHELEVVREYCPEKLERFAARFVNARAVAVRWRNRVHGGDKPESNTLADFLTLIGHEVPDAAGPGRTGRTIALLDAVYERVGPPMRMTEGQRRRWEVVREHNRHDCVGMRRVSILAARELEASESRQLGARAAVAGGS